MWCINAVLLDEETELNEEIVEMLFGYVLFGYEAFGHFKVDWITITKYKEIVDYSALLEEYEEDCTIGEENLVRKDRVVIVGSENGVKLVK